MTRNRLVITSILLLAALAVSLFFTWPSYKNFRKTSVELKNAKTELEYLSEYYANIEKLYAALEEQKPIIQKIDQAVTSRVSLPDIFNYLHIAASQNGVILGNIGMPQVAASKTNPQLKELRFQLSLSSLYPSLKTFLDTLYKSARLIEVDSVSFSSPKEDLFDFKVNIRMYSY